MKTRNLLLVLLAIVSFNLNAQNKEWNFSDGIWASADVKAGTTVDALTNYSINTKASVGNSKKNYTLSGEEFSFTACFKFGENGSFEDDGITPKTGVMSFEVDGNATISVVGVHASSSGAARELVVVAKGKDELVELGSFSTYSSGDASAPEELKGQLNSGTCDYTGEATTIYVYSRNGGVNLYLIKTAEKETTGTKELELNKEIEAVEFYDLLGKKVSDNAKGTLVKKTIYTDGSSSVSKITRN